VQVSPLGFNSNADEWLPRFSPRLSVLNWYSGGARGGLALVSPNLETEQERDLPSTANLPGGQDTNNAAAVYRPHTNAPTHKGPLFVELFNVMFTGKARGQSPMAFEALLNRLQSDLATKPCRISFTWVVDTISMLGKCADIITAHFANIFVEKIWTITDAYLQQLDDDAVRGIPNKEAVDVLILGLRRLLRRVFPNPNESALVAEKVMLSIGLRCCKSSQLMKRREGLRVLSEAVTLASNRDRYRPYGLWSLTYCPQGSASQKTDFTRMPVSLALSSVHIAGMITEQQLLRDIFVLRHHRELIKMSADLLRVLSGQENGLGETQVRVWFKL
jgi:hypothetical protein